MAKHEKGPLVKQIKESGIHFHVYPYESASRPLIAMLKQCWKVSKVFKSIAPDIIYSYHYAADYTEPLAAQMARIPWIYVKKNMSWYGPSKNAWYLRSLLSKKINVQNSEMESEFLYRFSKKLIHIPIGVDTKKFSPINGVEKNPVFSFIHVSSLLPIKGVEHLISAYQAFCNIIPKGHQLLIVGPDATEFVKTLKQKSKNYPNIIFEGKRKDVNELLNQSHCFIQSSLGKGEGCPVALQEAMVAGVVCIGSRVAGVNDLLRGFEDLQYDSENEVQLLERMKWANSLSVGERTTIGVRLRQRVLSKYSLELEINKSHQMLGSLLK